VRILVESPNCNALEGSNAAVGYGWIRALSRLHELHVVTYGSNYDRGHVAGAPALPNVHPIRLQPSRAAKLGSMFDFVLTARRQRDRLIRSLRPDIVHSLEPAGWMGPRALSTSAVPYVLGPLNGGSIQPPRAFAVEVLENLPVKPAQSLVRQGPRKLAVTLANEFTFGDTRTAHVLARRAMRRARRIVLGTDLTAGAFPPGLAGRVVRIPTQGIDLHRFSPKPRRSHEGPLRVIYAGRITAWKGLHLLIRAIAASPAHLTIYGGSTPQERWYEEHCRRSIDDLGAQERILWIGSVERDQLAEAYAEADVFAMLSLWEPFATTWIESMACGTPIIGLATGGMVEALRGQDAGWLIEPTTEADVVDRTTVLLDRLSHDKEEVRRAGDLARRIAEEQHSWERLAERMDAVYRDVT